MSRDSHWFEEFVKIIKIDVTFVHFSRFSTCLDHIPFRLLLFGLSRYVSTVKIRAIACSAFDIK